MLLKSGQFTFPTPPERLYGRAAPLVLEVGFGGGRFLQHLAGAHPEWNVLGVELSLSAVSRTYRRLRRAEARHVRIYRGRAEFVVREVLPPRSLHRVYVNFPDPWPKERHHDRRLLRTPFFRLLSTRLEDGGTLLLTTDHPEYFAYAQEQARASGLFDVAPGPPPEAALQTKYARKWRQQNKTIHHVAFTRTAEADDSYEPRLTLTDMHHAILQGEIPSLDAFDKQVHPIDGGHVILLDAYTPLDGPGFVITGLVEEHDFQQDVMLEVRPSERGIYVGVARFGDPLVTQGTSAAVGFVARWLEEQGMEVVEERY